MASKSGNIESDGGAAARRLRARIAANTRWAFEPDRTAATAAARRARDEKFLQLVDPEGVLDPRERALRAEAARRAHFLRMAAASAKARRRNRTPGPDAA
jgi:hypothetical protein